MKLHWKFRWKTNGQSKAACRSLPQAAWDTPAPQLIPLHGGATGAALLALSFTQPVEKGSISRLGITALEYTLGMPFQGKTWINYTSLNMRFNHPIPLRAASPLTPRGSAGRKAWCEPQSHICHSAPRFFLYVVCKLKTKATKKPHHKHNT